MEEFKPGPKSCTGDVRGINSDYNNVYLRYCVLRSAAPALTPRTEEGKKGRQRREKDYYHAEKAKPGRINIYIYIYIPLLSHTQPIYATRIYKPTSKTTSTRVA